MIYIYNEDCLEGMKKIPDKSIDLIVTDPPYKVTSRGNAGNSGGMLQKKINMKGQVFTHNDLEITDWIGEFYRVLKDGSHCYIMTNNKNITEYLNETQKAGFKFIKNIIWDKGNKIMGQFYMSQYEYIMFLYKGKAKKINNCSTPDILSIPNKKTKIDGKNIHDTEKPIELMKILIENSSNEGDIVLDPFVGSGSTLLACKELNRIGIGYEIDKEYYELACKRLKEHQKQLRLDLF